MAVQRSFKCSINSSSGSSEVGFKQAGAGAVARLAQDKLREVVSVLDFGADPSGILDSTAAIQAAINAVSSTGGIVFFSPGMYLITGTITVAAGNITLQGTGTSATNLLFSNGSLDCLVFNSGSSQLYRSHIYDLTVTGVSKTGGRALYLAYFANCNIERVDFQNVYTGLDIYVTNSITMRDVLINGVTSSSGYGIYWHAPSNGSARSDVLNCQNVTIQCNYSGADGIILDGLVQTLNWLHGGVLQVRRGLWVKNSGNSVSNTPGFIESFGLAIEGASSRCVQIEGGYQFRFINSLLTNMYGSNGSQDDYAVYIAADASYSITNSIKFDSCRIGLCAKQAVYSAARSIFFSNCTFPSSGMLASNTYPAVHFLSPARDIMFNGNTDYEWGSTSQNSYSVQIDSGVSRVTGAGNYFYSGISGAVLNNSANAGIELNSSNGSTKFPTPLTRGIPQAEASATGTTLTAAKLLGPILLRSGPTANFIDTTDTAANLITQIASPMVNGTFKMLIANTSAFQQTMLAGAGVTFGGNVSSGNFIIAGGVTRTFIMQITNCTAGNQTVTILG